MPRQRRRRDLDGIYERPDSPYYWASYIDASGQRVRRSTGIGKSIEGRREAEALLAKWTLEAHRERQWDEQPRHSFEELMRDYLTATAGERRSERTFRLHVRRLRQTFEGMEMEALTAAHITAYIRRRKSEGVSNTTVNRELEVLSAGINHAVREWEWRLPNPVPGRMLKEPEGRLRWLTRAEAAALIRCAEAEPMAPHLGPLIQLALHTGMRLGEMLGLEWTRVDLQRAMLYLEGQHTKAGKRRTVPLNGVARAALLTRSRFRAQHCPAAPWVFCNEVGVRIASVKRSFATACRKASIEDFRFHDLRHTCAAWLVQAGVPLAEVRDLLGHSTVQVTERYAHLAPENTRSAVSRLEVHASRSRHAGKSETGKATVSA